MILITGATGFIGKSLLNALGDNSVGLARKSDNKRIFKFDLTEPKNIDHLCNDLKKLDVKQIIHCAGVTPWSDNPNYSDDIVMAKTIVEICEKTQIEKIIYISGWNVYDQSCSVPFTESTPLKPTDEYGRSKLDVEEYLNLNLPRDKRLVSVRAASIYGPGQTSAGLIPNLVRTAVEEAVIRINARDTKRDYLYIDDFVKACEAISILKVEKNININVGSGSSISVMGIAEKIRSILDKHYNKSIKIEYPQEFYESSLIDNMLSIDKAKSLGLTTNFTDIHSGLRKYIEWYIDEYNI